MYYLLTTFIVFIHFFWILFLVFGFLFVGRRPGIALLHFSGLLFSLFLNFMGWYCPLTYLENYLRPLIREGVPYRGGFIFHYLDRVIYPDLPEPVVRVGGIVFVGLYFIFYVFWAKKYHLVRRLRGKEMKDGYREEI